MNLSLELNYKIFYKPKHIILKRFIDHKKDEQTELNEK